MKKSTIKKILAMAAIACLGCVTVACGKSGGSGNKVTLVDFNDESIKVGYGETYQLDLLGYSETGRPYAVNAEVKNSAGEKIEVLNGKFVVSEKEGYTITYTYGSQKRVVSLTIGANVKPVLAVDAKDDLVLCNTTYTISQATAYDYFDGELDVEVDVYQVKDSGNVSIEYDADAMTFTPTEEDTYYVTYTATNSAGLTSNWEVKIFSYVGLVNGDPSKKETLLKIDHDDYTWYYNPDVKSTYVKAGSEELEAIQGDYTGSAAKMQLFNNPNYRVGNPYSVEELAEFAKSYGQVSLWFAVVGIPGGEMFLYDNADTFHGKAFGGTRKITSADCGVWQRWVIDFSDYVQILQANNYQFFRLFQNYCQNVPIREGVDFYFGDVEFCNVVTE